MTHSATVTQVAAAAASAVGSTIAGPAAFVQRPFQGFVFFNIEVVVYTARKKLTPADIGIRAEDLPPATLASLGSMHSADPKALTKFESMRAAMRNACLVYGVRMLGGFAVPEDKALEVAQKLDVVIAEFYALKSQFLATFTADRQAWLKKPEFAQWTDKILSRLDSETHVGRQLNATYHAFTIGSPEALPKANGSTESPLADTVVKAYSAVGDQALVEVASIAITVREQSLEGRVEVTQKILSPIRKIVEKLDGLAFADPRLSRVVDYIRAEMGQLPKNGKMEGQDLLRIVNMVTALSDPTSILRVAKVVSCSASADEDAAAVLKEITDVPTSAALPAKPDDLDDESSELMFGGGASFSLAGQAGGDDECELDMFSLAE